MGRVGHKQTAVQRRCAEGFENEVRLWIYLRPGDQVDSDRPLRRMRRPQPGTTKHLTGYSENLEENVKERSHKLLSRIAGLYKVQFTTKSTVIIDKDGVATPVSPDRVTKMSRVLEDSEPLAGLHSAVGQSDSDMQREGGESDSTPVDPSSPEPAECATDQVVGYCGKESQTKYKVRCHGYRAEVDTNEPASKLPTSFF